MDSWVVSTFWLLWIMLLWTLEWISLFMSMLLILQSVHLGLILLNHIVILYLAFWESTKLFSIEVVPFYISIRNALKFQFIVILTNTCYFSVLFCFYNNYPNRCEVLSNWHLDILKHFLSQGTQNDTRKLLWIILSY